MPNIIFEHIKQLRKIHFALVVICIALLLATRLSEPPESVKKAKKQLGYLKKIHSFLSGEYENENIRKIRESLRYKDSQPDSIWPSYISFQYGDSAWIADVRDHIYLWKQKDDSTRIILRNYYKAYYITKENVFTTSLDASTSLKPDGWSFILLFTFHNKLYTKIIPEVMGRDDFYRETLHKYKIVWDEIADTIYYHMPLDFMKDYLFLHCLNDNTWTLIEYNYFINVPREFATKYGSGDIPDFFDRKEREGEQQVKYVVLTNEERDSIYAILTRKKKPLQEINSAFKIEIRTDKKRRWDLYLPVISKREYIIDTHEPIKELFKNEAYNPFSYGIEKFESQFAELNNITKYWQHLELANIDSSIDAIQITAGESFTLGGAKIPSLILFDWGILILLCFQLYFLTHLISFCQIPENKISIYPWLLLYNNLVAKTTSVISISILPVMTALVLILNGAKLRNWDFTINVLLWLGFATSMVLATLTVFNVFKIWGIEFMKMRRFKRNNI